MKNRKSPEIYNISAELLKESVHVAPTAPKLTVLFNRIIDEQEILSDWKRSLIVKRPVE